MTLPSQHNKPLSVFVTPVMPAVTGAGRAMRAYSWVRTLAVDYQVVVVVIDRPQTVTNELHSLISNIFFLSPISGFSINFAKLSALLLPFICYFKPSSCVDWPQISSKDANFLALQSYLTGKTIAKLLIFRIYLHGVAEVLRNTFLPKVVQLDNDDLESACSFSMMNAAFKLVLPKQVLFEFIRFCQYRFVELTVPMHYQQVYFACDADVLNKAVTNSAVWPNKVSLPKLPCLKAPHLSGMRVLFVGTLNYTPNVEAVVNLLLPLADLLYDHFGNDITLLIVGRTPSGDMFKALNGHPVIELHSDVPDLAPFYQQADIALVPVRYGGGTKIKTIEAFANRVPVVATLHGVRGLNAIAGRHYAAAETIQDFFIAICELSNDKGSRDKISGAAWELYYNTLSY